MVRQRITRKLEQAGQVGERTARERAPVDTGFLVSTIHYAVVQSESRLVLYADASYAIHQERGYVSRGGNFIPGHHYMAAGAMAATDHLQGFGNVTIAMPGME